MDHKTVNKLEGDIEQAVPEVNVHMGLERLLLLSYPPTRSRDRQ